MSTTWTYNETDSTPCKHLFTDTTGRTLELAEQTGNEWAAELYHSRGATRITVERTLDDLYTSITRTYSLPSIPEPNLRN